MITYKVIDTDNPNLPIHIDKKEFYTLETFHPFFMKFTNIVECLINFNQSKKRLLDFMKNTCDQSLPSLEFIYPDFKFLFFSNALFGRILIDNIRSNFNQLKIPQNDSIIIFEQRDEFKMMKILRDFGLHFSSPITDCANNSSFSSSIQTLEIYTDKSELKGNKTTNKQNKEFIASLKSEKINLIPYFNDWCDSIDELFDVVLSEFHNIMPRDVNVLLKKYFNPSIDIRKEFTLIFPNTIQKQEELDGIFINEEGSRYSISTPLCSYRFPRTTLKYLLFENPLQKDA